MPTHVTITTTTNLSAPPGPSVRDARGGVRCPTPGCGRKLAEALRGTLTIRCDRCRHTVTIARQ
jgi:predicted  nucleic acid-binding Zn ribbon protein